MLVVTPFKNEKQGGKALTSRLVLVQDNVHYKYTRRTPSHTEIIQTDTNGHAEDKKAVQGISQSRPYHYLPCKAHLTGRPPVQTSAIFTHLPSCVRSPQSHLVWKAKPELPEIPPSRAQCWRRAISHHATRKMRPKREVFHPTSAEFHTLCFSLVRLFLNCLNFPL